MKALFISGVFTPFNMNWVWLSGNIFNLSSSIGVNLLCFPLFVFITCLNLEDEEKHKEYYINEGNFDKWKYLKGAKREKITAQEVALKYTKLWQEDLAKLNIIPSDHYPKATEYIREQINLIKRLEKKGYTYITSDGVYFDTTKFLEYADFARPPQRFECFHP